MILSDLIVPPHSPESEYGALGGLLLDSEAIHRVGDLEAEAFYSAFHADAFRAIQALAVAGKAHDVITVGEFLKSSGNYDSSVFADLNAIAQYAPSAANVRRYAETVMDRYRSRLLMAAGSEISGIALAQGKPSDQIDQAQMILAKLATVKSKREPQHINQSLSDYLKLLQNLSEGKNPAIPTGIAGLDRILNGGMRRGEMMVIGARPKHGKTALALALARNFARSYSVLFMSQEMPVSQLMHRHIAAMGSVDLGRILRADATDQGMWERVAEAAERLGSLNLVHDDQSSLSLMDVRRKAIKVKRQYGLDVLFVDFLQLMQGAGEDNRNRELDVIVNGIKALALDLDIAVVVLSQMSRKADEHFIRPTMTHLRDSGAIEAAADQIALLFTDWAHPLSKREAEFKGFSELEIVAHRNGAQGLVSLSFVGELQQIGDWSGELPRHSKSISRGFDE